MALKPCSASNKTVNVVNGFDIFDTKKNEASRKWDYNFETEKLSAMSSYYYHLIQFHGKILKMRDVPESHFISNKAPRI